MTPSILSEPDNFISLVEQRLGKLDLDYSQRLSDLRKRQGERPDHLMAGVLVLLARETTSKDKENREDGFRLILTKRSSLVSQPGDLGCPGGIIRPIADRLLRPMITTGLVPVLKGVPLEQLKRRDRFSRHATTLFLTTALRETWEEIGLSPFNLRFLGPLPSYSLKLRALTIFPLVALIKKPAAFRLNDEVERIVSIPVSSFFAADNYASLSLETKAEGGNGLSLPGDFPCFIHRVHDTSDILWGATYQIITFFLKCIFDVPLPAPASGPRIVKELDRLYLREGDSVR
ncbi:MAG: CoA pyrophosphatase [Smithellaceae bacterium]|nr:CoA pyrophosphatase [Smithellaceae bacterium]